MGCNLSKEDNFRNMLKKYGYFIVLIISLSIFLRCARRGSPTGGPKDETPPVLLQVTPPSATTGFDKKKIRLVFDELVTIKDLRKQLIVSPPMENFPIVSPMNASRNLEISILDTLKPNTTYVFNFGNSIQDYNEGNVYKDFKYVFSTGKFIDSLKVTGKIKDALKSKPDKSIVVMLYEYNESYKDSVVYKNKPLYIGYANDSLNTFEINHIREGKYMLMAMQDKNNNYLFNQKEDKIAFLEQPIFVKGDTVISYELTLFKEKWNYKAARPIQASENRFIFGFEGDTDNVKIEPISKQTNDFKYVISKEPKKDTLNFWFSPKQDSLRFTITKGEKIDTFTTRLRKMKPDSLQISNLFSGDLPKGKYFGWKSNIPIMKTDTTKVQVFEKDSIRIPFKTKLSEDRLEYLIVFDAKYGESYRVKAFPDAMIDFFGKTNDTLEVKLRTKKQDEYSVLKLTLKGEVDYPILIQLTDEKGDVHRELYTEKPENQYIFEAVPPKKYRLRIIEDKNGNKKWDTGNFLKRQQAEKIIHHPKEIELRANWDIEETFSW